MISAQDNSRLATWAGVDFYWTALRDEASQQTAQRIAQGIEGQRIDNLGIITKYWTSFSGGMVRRGGIHPDTDMNQVWYNQGLQTHVPYQLTLPYALTTQATFLSGDFSGYRAANKRVHSVIFSGRYVGAVGSVLFTDTSTSDPTLKGATTDDGITDNVTAMWVGMVGTTPAVFIGTDGTTDDISYTTNPFADTVSWTKFVTLGNAADYISAGQYFPEMNAHVIVGRIGNSPTAANGVWFVDKDASLPATAQPVVFTDTKDQLGSISSVTTSDMDGTVVTTSGFVAIGTGSGGAVWGSPSNVLSSNDSRASFDTYDSANPAATPYLYVSGFPIAANVPRAARMTGASMRIEARAGTNVAVPVITDVLMLIRGSQVGLNQAVSGLTTSDANYDHGSSTNDWGTGGSITGDDLRSLAIAVRFAGRRDGASDLIEVDYIGKLAVTYQMPGTQIKVQSGGFSPGPWLTRPNTLVYVEPETDDETGVTKSRKLMFINCEYDTAGERVTASIEYPDTGLSYVEDCFPWQGGIMNSGNKSSGLGKQLKHVDANGAVRQYQFPGFHGSHNVGVVMGYDEGVTALFEVADEDGTETQFWRLVDQQFHASTPLQSKSNAIASLPLAHAERTLHKPQNHAYRFFPVSTTHLAAARTFVPRNPLNDVMSTNTTQNKQDGPLYLITPEFELGNMENESALMLTRHGGRQISAVGGSYGTVTYDWEVSTESASIDTTFASPDVTTGALDAAFEEYQVPSAGKAYRTIQGRITLDNDGTANNSTKTPNGVPFITETASGRPHLSQLRVFVDWKETILSNTDWLNFVDRMLTASAGSPVNALEIGGIGKPCQLIGWSSEWKPEDIEQPLKDTETDKKGNPTGPWLLFRQHRGTV